MAVERWAMIKDGEVINVCLWDGDTNTWPPPEGIEMQPAGETVGTGWRWINGSWEPPLPPPPPPEDAPDEQLDSEQLDSPQE